MVAAVVLAFTFLVMQAGSTIVTPPAPAPSGSSTTVNNTTNVFPPPDPAVVVETEKQAGPVIVESAFRSADKGAADDMAGVFKLALTFGKIRKDVIESSDLNTLRQGFERMVKLTIGLVVAALCLWGLFGTMFGSDGREAFEALGRVPLWCILALTLGQWYPLVLDGFAAIGNMIVSSSTGVFGPTLRPDFWSNTGLSLFAVFVGLFYFAALLLFALQLFANTAFLAFAFVVGPVFVFLKTTPWTSHWGDNWFRMVPGTAGDLLAMLALLVIGAEGMQHITADNAFATIALDLGLLACLPLVRRLFGLEGNSVGGMFSPFAWARIARRMRGAGGTATVASGAAATSPTQPTRAPRWSNAAGTAVTRKSAMA